MSFIDKADSSAIAGQASTSPPEIDIPMSFLNSNAEISLLQDILQAKLIRVFYYTRYSLLVSGHARLTRYCFFTDQATSALEETREITRALVLLDATDGLSIRYPEESLEGLSFGDMLKQAIAAEGEILNLCRVLEQHLGQTSSYFLGLSRSLSKTTRQNMTKMRKMLVEEATPAKKLSHHNFQQAA